MMNNNNNNNNNHKTQHGASDHVLKYLTLGLVVVVMIVGYFFQKMLREQMCSMRSAIDKLNYRISDVPRSEQVLSLVENMPVMKQVESFVNKTVPYSNLTYFVSQQLDDVKQRLDQHDALLAATPPKKELDNSNNRRRDGKTPSPTFMPRMPVPRPPPPSEQRPTSPAPSAKKSPVITKALDPVPPARRQFSAEFDQLYQEAQRARKKS